MNSAAQAIDLRLSRKVGRLVTALLLFPLLAASSFAQTPVPAASNLHQWGAITLFHGLPSDRVRAIAQTPDGTLWFGTDNGLARYDGRRVQKVGAGEFDSSRILALKVDDDGALWMGTSTGAARVFDGRVQPIAATRTKTITAIAVAHTKRAFLATDHGEIFECVPSPGAPVVALDVAAASSRTFPEQFQYAFSVFDAAGERTAHKLSSDSQLLIENLTPGRYRVSATAFTKDLVASRPFQFEFAVAAAPFPWTSTALGVLLVLALVAMGWGYLQNTRLSRANRTLAETRLQLANETETERRRIARDLHDQTLADLRRLMLLTDRGQIQPATMRAEIESVSTEIRRICEALSPSALVNLGLAAALEWAITEAAANQPPGHTFIFTCDLNAGLEEELELRSATTIQIYRIAQEAISNASKHAAATHIILTLGRDAEGAMVLALEDNGAGFNADQPGRTGHGLANIRSRASLIGATATWSARPGGGTIFTLRR